MNKVSARNQPDAVIPNDQVVSAARQFRQMADYLYERIAEHNCVSPLLMIAAFGIELYLKSLNSRIVYSQDELLKSLGGYQVTAEPLRTGHRLVELFDAIDPQFRDELENMFVTGQYRIAGQTTIRAALQQYNRQFEEARYYFEDTSGKQGASITGLVQLLRIIANHIEKMEMREYVCVP